jgi:hypothetical protein
LTYKLGKNAAKLIIYYYLPGPGMSLFFTKSARLLLPKEKPFLVFYILIASPFLVTSGLSRSIYNIYIFLFLAQYLSFLRKI